MTLQDSLMARLDRLASVKRVAQVGAAIGREFTHDLLAAVMDIGDEELCDALDRLAGTELVFRHREATTSSYVFKHALVRDVAYSSLSRARRRELHAQIAAVLEDSFPQMVANEPEALAHHWLEAGSAEKASGYYLSAGTLALRRSATAEAVAQLTLGLEALQHVSDAAIRERRELDLQVAFGAALVAARGPAATEPAKAYMRARELCLQLGEHRLLIPVLFGLWASHNVRNELSAAHSVAVELLDLAKQRPESPAQILGHRALGTTFLLQGKFAASREYLERLLKIPRKNGRSDFPYPFDPWLTGQAYLSISVLLLGYPDQALAHARQALAGAHQLGHQSTLALVLFCRCVLGQLCRDEADLETHAEALSSVAAERGFAFWSAAGTVFRGWSLAESGKLLEGTALMRDGLAAYEAAGARAYLPEMSWLLAEVQRRAGHADQAQRLLNDVLDQTKRTETCAGEAELYRLQGQVLLNTDRSRPIEAKSYLRKAVEIARRQGARWLELRAAVSLARLLAAQGEHREAVGLLRPIHGWFTEGSDTPDLQDAQALLDELS
jgi:predicted ATPase